MHPSWLTHSCFFQSPGSGSTTQLVKRHSPGPICFGLKNETFKSVPVGKWEAPIIKQNYRLRHHNLPQLPVWKSQICTVRCLQSFLFLFCFVFQINMSVTPRREPGRTLGSTCSTVCLPRNTGGRSRRSGWNLRRGSKGVTAVGKRR